MLSTADIFDTGYALEVDLKYTDKAQKILRTFFFVQIKEMPLYSYTEHTRKTKFNNYYPTNKQVCRHSNDKKMVFTLNLYDTSNFLRKSGNRSTLSSPL